MPKDNIERAIKKASGADAENYDEVRYEGYAPGGVAVIIEALTDNRNRTAGEVRSYFTKAGGALAETGAVSFMFDRVGLDRIRRKVADEDDDDGGGDRGRRRRRRPTPRRPRDHHLAGNAARCRQGAGSEIRRAAEGRSSIWRRRTRSRSTTRPARRSCSLIGALEDNDDVQNVYANFEVSDALVAKMGG